MMARTVRHTRTITQELRPPWIYRVQGALGTLAALGALLFVLWLLASWNF
jgi:hypothetical protein